MDPSKEGRALGDQPLVKIIWTEAKAGVERGQPLKGGGRMEKVRQEKSEKIEADVD